MRKDSGELKRSEKNSFVSSCSKFNLLKNHERQNFQLSLGRNRGLHGFDLQIHTLRRKSLFK